MIIFSRKTNGCWVPPFKETPIWQLYELWYISGWNLVFHQPGKSWSFATGFTTHILRKVYHWYHHYTSPKKVRRVFTKVYGSLDRLAGKIQVSDTAVRQTHASFDLQINIIFKWSPLSPSESSFGNYLSPRLTRPWIAIHPIELVSQGRKPLTFQYAGCLIGILIMVYYNPHIIG